MQLIINEKTLNANSFTETINTQHSDQDTSVTVFSVTINVSWADSIEDLAADFADFDNGSFIIKDAESDKQREYTNFKLNQISQEVEDFHQIITTLRFEKEY